MKKNNVYNFCKYNLFRLMMGTLLITNFAFAYRYEMAMKITSNGQHLIGDIKVYLYRVDDLSAPYRQGVSFYVDPNAPDYNDIDNITSDISGVNGEPNTPNPSWPMIDPGTYYIRVDNYYIGLQIGPPEGSGDFRIIYDSSAHTFTYIDVGRGESSYLFGNVQQWTTSTASIIIDQFLNDNSTRTGSIKRWTVGSFDPLVPLGRAFDMSQGINQVLRADQDIQSGQKYNYWSAGGVTQSDVINHHVFSISSQTGSLVSHFIPTNNATLQSILLDDGSNIGAPNFKDPWFIDTTDSYGQRNQGMNDWHHPISDSQNNIGTGSAHLGVFLNQNLNFLPDLPVYSISAPDITSGSLTYKFSNWSGSNVSFQSSTSATTPVVFTNSSPTTTANYKAYLATFSTTASNNQRKISAGSNLDDFYTIVYESGGRIWATRGTPGTWTNEKEISTGTTNSYPAVVERGNTAYIVWQSISWNGSSGTCYIYFRTMDLGNLSLSAQQTVRSFTVSSQSFTATPVIDGSQWSIQYPSHNTILVGWRDASVLAVRGYFPYYNSWTNSISVTNTNSNCYFPSVAAHGSVYLYNSFALAWVDYTSLQKINYTEVSCIYSNSISFTYGAQVSLTGWESNDRPCIAFANGTYPTVSWESRNNVAEGVSSVHERQKSAYGSGGSWGGITSYSMSNNGSLHSSVGTYNGNNKVSLLWHFGTSIYTASYNGSSWGSASTIGSGTESNLIASTIGDQIGLWKKSDNNLSITSSGIQQKVTNTGFAAQGNRQLSVSSGGLSSSTPIPFKLNKHGIIELDSVPQLAEAGFGGMVAFEISSMGITSGGTKSKVKYHEEDPKFSAILDTTDAEDLERYSMKSMPFTVGSNSDAFEFAGAYYAKSLTVPKKPGTKIFDLDDIAVISLKDASTNETVKELWRVPFTQLLDAAGPLDGDFRKISVPLNGLKDRELYLDVKMMAEPIIVDDHLLLDQTSDQSDTKGNIAVQKQNDRVVTQYLLHQNYPNPFNPSTTISFDLVEPQHIILKLYNTVGQEMMTLADGYYNTGAHEIILNGSNLSSGVYFYRITSEKLNDTKSLMLLK